MFRTTTRRQARPGGGLGMRLIIGLIVAAFALISYFMSSEYNPVTDSEQHLSLTPQQEIALGLQSVPSLVQEFGGLYPDEQVQARDAELRTQETALTQAMTSAEGRLAELSANLDQFERALATPAR